MAKDEKPVLLVTRPTGAADKFLNDVMATSDVIPDIVMSPALSIRPINVDLHLKLDEGLIFTSKNGVDQAHRLGVAQKRTAYCVGQATTNYACELGFDAVFGGETANALEQFIMHQEHKGPFVHISGKHVRGDIVGNLRRAGMKARRCVAYDQISLPLTDQAKRALTGSQPVVLPLFSPRSAALLAGMNITAPLYLILISDAVKMEIEADLTAIIRVAPQPDAENMVKETVNALNHAQNGRFA